MNRIIPILLFAITSFTAFSQTTYCPKIIFSYDDAGNRIERSLIVAPCVDMRLAPPPPKDSQTVLQAEVFPNPAMSSITVQLSKAEDAGSGTIQLYDLHGKIVRESTITSPCIVLDVNGLGAGTYLLKVTSGKRFASYNIKKS